jgi:hypothetical protein
MHRPGEYTGDSHRARPLQGVETPCVRDREFRLVERSLIDRAVSQRSIQQAKGRHGSCGMCCWLVVGCRQSLPPRRRWTNRWEPLGQSVHRVPAFRRGARPDARPIRQLLLTLAHHPAYPPAAPIDKSWPVGVPALQTLGIRASHSSIPLCCQEKEAVTSPIIPSRCLFPLVLALDLRVS